MPWENKYLRNVMQAILCCVSQPSAGFRQSSIILSVTLWEKVKDPRHGDGQLMKKTLEDYVGSILFCLGKIFGSHVFRLSFEMKDDTHRNWVMESLRTIGGDLRYSSFIGEAEAGTAYREDRNYQMRLVMVSKCFKGYSEENDSKEWAMQCPNCEIRCRRTQMTELRW